MDYSHIIHAALIGNCAYDLVSAGVQLSVESLKIEMKQKSINWTLDDEQTRQIVNRINILGLQEDEDRAQYIHRLDSDLGLSDLLQNTINLLNEKIANDEQKEKELQRAQRTKQSAEEAIIHLPEKPPKLIGRDREIKELLALIANDNCEQKLVKGMGGVGKSVICRNLAYAAVNHRKIRDILWFNCHNGIEAEARSIAIKYHIDIDCEQWWEVFLNRLRQSSMPSIIFLDNIEEVEEDLEKINDLQNLQWNILATSRYSLDCFEFHHVIESLDAKQCGLLFAQHYYKKLSVNDKKDLEELLTLAGHHTLTIELLAKIASDEKLDVSQLLSQVKKTGFNLSYLTDKSVDGTHSATELVNERHMQLHEHLERLFSLAHIPEKESVILRKLAVFPSQYYRIYKELIVWFSLKTGKLFNELNKKGWLQCQEDNYSVHPVIRYVVARKIPIRIAYLQIIANSFCVWLRPKSNESWIEKSAYEPHLLAFKKFMKEDCFEKSLVLFSLANIFYAQQRKDNTEQYFRKSFELQKAEEKLLIEASNNKRIYLTQIQTQKDYLTKVKLALFETANKLAIFYKEKKQLDAALEYANYGLKVVEKTHGVDHPNVGVAKGVLAGIHKEMGDFEIAYGLYESAYRISKSKLPKDDNALSHMLNNLANLLNAMQDTPKALELYERALAIREKNVSKDHPSIATILINLGMMHKTLNQYETSLTYFERALLIIEQSFGDDSIGVANILKSMGIVLAALDKVDKAKESFERALVIMENEYGRFDPRLCFVINNLASLFVKNGQYKPAITLLVRVQNINEQVYGVDSPAGKIGLTNLAQVYVTMAEEEDYLSEPKALDGVDLVGVTWFWRLFKEANGNKLTSFRPYQLVLGQAFFNRAEEIRVAALKQKQTDYAQLELALVIHEKVQRFRKVVLLKRFGEDNKVAIKYHPDTIESIIALGQTYDVLGRQQGFSFLKDGLDRLEFVLGSDHLEVATGLVKKGDIYRNRTKLGTAEFLYQKALRTRRKKLGDAHPLTSSVLKRINVMNRVRKAS